jgi:hypothetical protein
MITEMGSVMIITGEGLHRPGIHAVLARHRSIPFLCGEGATAREAVEDLMRKLMRESSSVSGWRLASLEPVIADVRATLDLISEPSLEPMAGS